MKAILTIEPPPESCGDCPVNDFTRGLYSPATYRCRIEESLPIPSEVVYTQRADWCPLEIIESEGTKMKKLTLESVIKVQKQVKKMRETLDDSGSPCILSIDYDTVHIGSNQAFWNLAENQEVMYRDRGDVNYPFEAYFVADGVKWYYIDETPIEQYTKERDQ